MEETQVTSPAPAGQDEAAASFAGFKTPEELATAYQSAQSEREILQQQISNLESLKGRQGNELGQLRQKVAELTGHIDGLKSSLPAQQKAPTMQEIAAKAQAGEIGMDEALLMASKVSEQNFKQLLQKEIGSLKEQTAKEKYVARFMSENPGYKEAFEGGKLQSWLDQGMTGEEAWDKYQLQATKAENESLKKQAQEAAKKAEQSGMDKGIQLEKSKSAAGRVLSGKGGKFAQVTSNYDLKNPNQRLKAGVDVLNKMRSGA